MDFSLSFVAGTVLYYGPYGTAVKETTPACGDDRRKGRSEGRSPTHVKTKRFLSLFGCPRTTYPFIFGGNYGIECPARGCARWHK